MQLGYLIRFLLFEHLSQDVGEQVMIAIPMVLGIYRNDKEAGVLQEIEDIRAVLAIRHGITKRS